MINRVVLVGRLTKDPELKYTQTGIAVTRFTLAVNRAFQSASGEREADFISCVAWRKQAENIANFLEKGVLPELMAVYRRAASKDKMENVSIQQKL